MFVLGIDPGLSRCGYGAVRDGAAGGSGGPGPGPDPGGGGHGGRRLEAVAVGHLSTDPDAPLAERLGILLGDLEGLLADLRPDVVAVERVLFQVNVRTAMSVGQASGLALAVAARAGIPVVQYSPNEVKQAVAGYGSATKEQVQRMVQTLLGLREVPRPADRADALALAICHLSGARLRQAAAVAGAGRLGRVEGVGR